MASGDTTALLGEVLGGRFRITSLIGKGSMGTVYCATDTRGGKQVAVKVLARPVAADGTALARFKREAKAASRLRHDGCAEIIDYGVDGGLPYIAMELLSGETLYRLLERMGQLTQELTIAIGVKVCEVLEVAHEHGIVHRDLKPENIMVVPSHPGDTVRIKVLDFGIVKLFTPAISDDSQSSDSAISRLTHPGTALGTPAFMAPEQVRGDAIDDRTDIYVVGILLYEMVTGRVPFLGDDPVQVLQAQLREPPPPPSEFVPGLHPELESAILTCLEKPRAARWATARLLRRKLEQLLAEIVDGGRRGGGIQTEPTAGGDEDYQLTEPVDLRWLQQRRAAMQDLGAGRSPTGAPRGTAETRLVDSDQENDADENLATNAMRAVGARETADTAVRRSPPPRLRGGPGRSPRGTAETRLVGGSASAGVHRGGAAASASSARESDDIPTIEVYDDDGQDVEMLISTMVKPLENVGPELEGKLRRAGLGAWVGGRRGVGGTLIDDEAPSSQPSQPASSQPPQPASSQPPQPASSRPPQAASSQPPQPAASHPPRAAPPPRPITTVPPEEAERTLHRQRDAPVPAPPRAPLDSVISIDADDVDLVDSSSDHLIPSSPSDAPLLVDDDQLDQMKTMARPAIEEDEAPELSTRVKGSLDDMQGELATAVKALTEEEVESALATAVKRSLVDAEDELETTVRAPEDAARDLEIAMAARRMAGTATAVEEPTAVKSTLADDHAELATAVKPRLEPPPPADSEDMNPTTMMPRSQLSDGLPPHLQRALEAELGPMPLADTVDDTPASLPAPTSVPPSDRELPPLVEPKRAQRTVPLTAPLPQFTPMQPPADGAPLSSQQPASALGTAFATPPGAETAGGGEDLEQLLQRMPRTRYPVASTLLALLVMGGLVAGLVWLLLW